MKHGMIDYFGRPVNPWIVVVPNGDMSAPDGEGKASTELYGPGLLYPVTEVYNHWCRLVSMQLTQVAKNTDPATVTFIRDGKAIPEPLDTNSGARNFLLYGESDFKVLDLAPNPGNLVPLSTALQDDMNKSSLPGVFYGNSGGVNSGYGVGILTNAALDNLVPYTDGVTYASKLLMRRMLEITYHVTATTHGAIPFQAPMGLLQRPAYAKFDPAVIKETGVAMDVTLGEMSVQDRNAAAQYVIGLVGAGIMSRYRARVEMGIPDPLLEFSRQGLESLLSDPMVAAMIGPREGFQSDEDWAKAAAQMKMAVMQMMNQMGAAPGKNQPNMTNTAAPTETSVGPNGRAGMRPAEQDAGQMAENDVNAQLAQWLAMQGGSPPAV